MYKVIIADDEPKVTQLIKSLIDWETLNLELVDIAKDGITAFEMIKTYQPDIVITDIRMPGYDGLELIRMAKGLDPNVGIIIISGYQHFDYAQNAIKYGVEDYLLKPLKKVEINASLAKMIEKFKEKRAQVNEHLLLHQQANDNKHKVRESLMNQLFADRNYDFMQLDRVEVNKEYQFNFHEGQFQAIVVKPDIYFNESNENVHKLVTDMTKKIVEKHLVKFCYDQMVYPSEEGIICILNYGNEQKKHFRKALINIMDEVNTLRDLFENLKITISIGSGTNNLNEIGKSVKEAYLLIKDRIVVGSGKIIDNTFKNEQKLLIENMLAFDMRREISKSIEILNMEDLEKTLLDIEKNISSSGHMTGQTIKDIVYEILDIVIYELKNCTNIQLSQESILKDFNMKFQMCNKVKDVFELLNMTIKKVITDVVEEKKNQNNRPIREAQKFINEHYPSQITLKEVSTVIGLNATYFSTLFKKETGLNFLEYVTSVRIREAKRLLSDSKMSVSDVAYEVGYSDLKHFSKQFKKITGLNPSQYRKLYY